jgi:hypothetical protein
VADYSELQKAVGSAPRLGESRWRALDKEIIRLRASAAVLVERERELLELKGPCSNKSCRLHRAHSGPCAPRGSAPVEGESQHA